MLVSQRDFKLIKINWSYKHFELKYFLQGGTFFNVQPILFSEIVFDVFSFLKIYYSPFIFYFFSLYFPPYILLFVVAINITTQR